MQEEIEHKTVNLAISTTKLSARTLLRGMQFLLRQYDKHASQGKQSMKRLVRQNRGVTNVEIQKTGIQDFYGVSRTTLVTWIREEGIPTIDVGRAKRVRKDVFDDVLKSKRKVEGDT